jgi:hypothetical protein
MAYSYERSTGDGSNRLFTIPFPYISKSHIHVYIDGVEDTGFTWINSGMIQTSGSPAIGTVVERRRTTPRTGALVTFTNASTLGEGDLNKAVLQELYISQEAFDTVEDALRLSQIDVFDAHGKRISNVANATQTADAVNKGQLDTAILAAGNVVIPTAPDVGKWLRATALGVWAWTALAWSDISGLIQSNISSIASWLNLGTAATRNVGTGANNIVQLDANAKLPAIDGSQLVNMPAPTSGRLLNVVVFTASGTYTKNPASNFVIAHVMGGGGGANGATGAGSISGSACSGAGGGYSMKRILTSALGATETVTVGAGGSRSASGASSGGGGGTSSFGAWCTATGGGQQNGGNGSGGDINLVGEGGHLVPHYGNAGIGGAHGGRAAGPFAGGPGVTTLTGSTNGSDAMPNGGGGGSSGVTTYNTAATVYGGAGGSGIVVIYEYA